MCLLNRCMYGTFSGGYIAHGISARNISGVAFVFTLGYLIQIIWRNAHVKPQQAPNTPGLPSA